MGMLLLSAVCGSGQRDCWHDQEICRDKGHDTGQRNDRTDPFPMQDMFIEEFSDFSQIDLRTAVLSFPAYCVAVFYSSSRILAQRMAQRV